MTEQEVVVDMEILDPEILLYAVTQWINSKFVAAGEELMALYEQLSGENLPTPPGGDLKTDGLGNEWVEGERPLTLVRAA